MSSGPYATLNLSLSVGDDPGCVLENRRRLAASFGASPEDFVFARQVHGAAVRVVGVADRGSGASCLDDAVADADALVTTSPGVVLAILTADCVPIVLHDPVAAVLACVHAGWRGTVAGVTTAALAAMQAFGSRPSDVIAGIGPAIAAARYQVGADVHQAVTQAFGPAAAAFIRPDANPDARPDVDPDAHPDARPDVDPDAAPESPNRWLLDLWAANHHALVEAGVPAPQIHTTTLPTGPTPHHHHPRRPRLLLQRPLGPPLRPPRPRRPPPRSRPETNGCDTLMTLLGTVPHSCVRGSAFRYAGFGIDAERGVLSCRYELDGREFTERVTLPAGPRWHTEAARAAARLVFLLAGVSYYKTAAPPVVDFGETALTDAEHAFLREFYLQGLGEFAYRNALDLTSLRFEARRASPVGTHPLGSPLGQRRALVPFGGGIDSIVTVERVRRRADAALFVVSGPADRFDAIEQPAAVTGLPVVRAEREIDPQLLRSAELGFLNGHVPVTGILSAIAVLAAVLEDRDAVVMSNEWSASVPTLEYQGRPVNHQFSKSEQFEAAFRDVLANCPAPLPSYFSWLRDRTELWVGQEFAALEPYHGSFRSCNKAFYTERARRLDHWCGQCDKCCFIDLILAPFLPAEALRRIFAVTGEPLEDPGLAARFRSLLGAGAKPFECVGEVTECRAAVLLAARRDDRVGAGLLHELAAEVAAWPDAPSEADAAAMLQPVGRNFIPARYQ